MSEVENDPSIPMLSLPYRILTCVQFQRIAKFHPDNANWRWKSWSRVWLRGTNKSLCSSFWCMQQAENQWDDDEWLMHQWFKTRAFHGWMNLHSFWQWLYDLSLKWHKFLIFIANSYFIPKCNTFFSKVDYRIGSPIKRRTCRQAQSLYTRTTWRHGAYTMGNRYWFCFPCFTK